MTFKARQLIEVEMTAFRTARSSGDSRTAWHHLERAHIISQSYLTLHIANHWAMLKFALSHRDLKEFIGQIMRLALAPLGALTGRVPVGNSGRSNVGAFRSMPIPEDLRAAIEKGE